jgi:hypothetical protein
MEYWRFAIIIGRLGGKIPYIPLDEYGTWEFLRSKTNMILEYSEALGFPRYTCTAFHIYSASLVLRRLQLKADTFRIPF